MNISKVKYKDIKKTTNSGSYLDFDSIGINLEFKDGENTKNSKDYSFKVIRTPISCRTFMIGGKENKGIRELVLIDPKTPGIEYLNCRYSVEVSDSFSLFCRSSSMFTLKSEESADDEEEKKS
jgi:hypothetical protein